MLKSGGPPPPSVRIVSWLRLPAGNDSCPRPSSLSRQGLRKSAGAPTGHRRRRPQAISRAARRPRRWASGCAGRSTGPPARRRRSGRYGRVSGGTSSSRLQSHRKPGLDHGRSPQPVGTTAVRVCLGVPPLRQVGRQLRRRRRMLRVRDFFVGRSLAESPYDLPSGPTFHTPIIGGSESPTRIAGSVRRLADAVTAGSGKGDPPDDLSAPFRG